MNECFSSTFETNLLSSTKKTSTELNSECNLAIFLHKIRFFFRSQTNFKLMSTSEVQLNNKTFSGLLAYNTLHYFYCA